MRNRSTPPCSSHTGLTTVHSNQGLRAQPRARQRCERCPRHRPDYVCRDEGWGDDIHHLSPRGCSPRARPASKRPTAKARSSPEELAPKPDQMHTQALTSLRKLGTSSLLEHSSPQTLVLQNEGLDRLVDQHPDLAAFFNRGWVAKVDQRGGVPRGGFHRCHQAIRRTWGW